MPPPRNILFLVQEGQVDYFLKLKQRTNFIGIGSPSRETIADIKHDCIFVSPCQMADLLSRIQAIFQKYNKWERSLSKILLSGKSRNPVSDLAKASLSIFESSICIHDANQKIIALALQEGDSSQTVTKTNYYGEILSDDAHRRFIDAIQENSPDENPFLSKNPSFWKLNNGEHSLAMNSFFRGVFVARIVLTSYGRSKLPSKKDMGPLRILATYVGTALSISLISPMLHQSDTLSTMIVNIIEKKPIHKSDYDYACNLVGWNGRTDTFFVCAIASEAERGRSASSYSDSSYQLLSLSDFFEAHHCDFHIFSYNKTSCIVANMAKSTTDYQSIVSKLTKAAIAKRQIVGVSRPIIGLKKVRSAYLEAHIALSYAPKSVDQSINGGVVTIDDAMLPYIEHRITSEVSILSLCPTTLLDIIHLDNAHGTSMYETLQTYVNSNCNQSLTAETLFLHRNTLRDKLKKILSILDMDISDSDIQLKLRLSFKLLNGLPSEIFHSI